MALVIKNTRDGGRAYTVTLNAEQVAALGADADMLADYLDSTMWALAMLRTGHAGEDHEAPSVADWGIVVNHLDTRLTPRIAGIRDAAIRAHAEAGGTHGELATSMDVPRSTAQARRDALTARTPSGWERWAREGGPQH